MKGLYIQQQERFELYVSVPDFKLIVMIGHRYIHLHLYLFFSCNLLDCRNFIMKVLNK